MNNDIYARGSSFASMMGNKDEDSGSETSLLNNLNGEGFGGVFGNVLGGGSDDSRAPNLGGVFGGGMIGTFGGMEESENDRDNENQDGRDNGGRHKTIMHQRDKPIIVSTPEEDVSDTKPFYKGLTMPANSAPKNNQVLPINSGEKRSIVGQKFENETDDKIPSPSGDQIRDQK